MGSPVQHPIDRRPLLIYLLALCLFGAALAGLSWPASSGAQQPPICAEYPDLPGCSTAVPGPGNPTPDGPGPSGTHNPGSSDDCVRARGDLGRIARVYDAACHPGGGQIATEPDGGLTSTTPPGAGGPSAAGLGGAPAGGVPGGGGSLPFTGYPLDGLILLAGALLIAGLALRAYRAARERLATRRPA
jgi:hypothetical protein